MSEATLILKNMRGDCVTVGSTVHTLFRYNGRPTRQAMSTSSKIISAADIAEAIKAMAPRSAG